MYQHTNKYHKSVSKSYTNRARTERNRQGGAAHLPVRDIPSLRRVIEITDYDASEPVVHTLELFRSDRIDCYDVYIDGSLWRTRIGWSQILAGIRKAIPRTVRE